MCPPIGREPVALGIAPAIRQVMRMRMDTWWGCNRLARFGVIDPGWEDLCPFCTEMELHMEVPETTVHAILECPTWAMQREQFLQPAIGGIQALLREVHTSAVAEQRLEYQNLDEGEWNLLRGLLGGQPFGDVLPNHLAPGNRSEWWNCSEPKRQEHVQALISFVHAILPFRGPVIRTLIATQSQNRNR
jgi:hypothetical protein